MQDDINYLNRLISELLPYMYEDVRSGLFLKIGPNDHQCLSCTEKNQCADCEWYEESVVWKSRIDSGEFERFGDFTL